jgi:hypothetical protein
MKPLLTILLMVGMVFDAKAATTTVASASSEDNRHTDKT